MLFTDTLPFICLLTLLNLGWIKTSNVTCHSQCACPTKSTVDCSNKGLHSVPTDLPSNSSFLLLNGNQLQTLSPEILSSQPLLKEINLSNNSIDCNCSLSWILNGSINLRVVGECHNPPSLKGRAIGDLSIEEMCDLRLTTTVTPVEKFVGETVSLNCQPSSAASMRWLRKTAKNSQLQDVQALGSRFRVLQNGTLVIGKLKKSDQGDYICLVEHEYGASRNKSVVLMVKSICKIDTTSVSNMPTVKPTKSYYVANDVLNLACPDGFVLNGSSTLMCRADGTWNYDIFPTCQATCKIDSTSNIPTVKPTKSFYIANDVLSLSCADGFVLNGSSTVVCREDGTWDTTVFPKCQAICRIDAASVFNMPKVKPTKTYYVADDILSLSCGNGYILNGSSAVTCLADGSWNTTVFPTCQDQDECKLGRFVCDTNAKCFNTEGFYNCTCKTGYDGDGKNCTDKNECSSGAVSCYPHSDCENLPGTYRCKCKEGYQENGMSCQKILLPSTPVPMTTGQTESVTSTKTEKPPDLKKLIKQSNGTQLTPESLKDSLVKLEIGVYRLTYSERKETSSFLNLASNLMGKQNHATWAETKQSLPGVERLLRAVNEAVKLRAVEMLHNNSKHSEYFSATFDNLDAEIQVGVGDMMAKKRIEFPSKRSSQDDHIEFPPSIFEKAGKQKVAIVGIRFKELGGLLPKRSLISNIGNFQMNLQVLSGSIITSNGSLSGSVTITFQDMNVRDIDKKSEKCVFWKYDEMVKNFSRNTYRESLNVSQGGWSDNGCTLLSRNRSSTICQCNHLTDFAVLIPRTKKEREKIPVIVYIGCIFLLIALLTAFIRNVIIWRQTKRERLFVLINRCIAIMLVVVVYLLGVLLDYDKTMCAVFAILIHWFVSSVFSWSLVEEIQLFLTVRSGWSRDSTRLKYFLLLGWFVPFIVVSIALAATRLDGYGSTEWCWYDRSLTLLLCYVCPIALCVMVSLVVILKVACLKAAFTDDTEKKDVSVILALSGFLIPLVAVTFVTSAFSHLIFAIFCFVLGIYILLYHCWWDREITKVSIRSNKRARPKRDYYSTKETVMYSEGTSEGKSFSLIFPSRKSPTHGKKSSKGDTKRSNKRTDSASPFDYDSSLPLYPSINDSSLKSFRSQVSTQQHTLESPPNTMSAIKISRPNSQCIELTSLADLDRGNERPDGAEQTDPGEHSEFYGSRNNNSVEKVRERTSGSSDYQNASTFGKENDKPIQRLSDRPNGIADEMNRMSATSSAGVSRTSRSTEESETSQNEDTYEKEPFLRSGNDQGPEVRSDPPAKIPKRRKRGSGRRLDGDFQEEELDEPKIRYTSSSLPHSDETVKLKQYKSF